MRKKRKPWPRWAKIVRNVLLAVLLLLLIWDAWDRPAISSKAALRKRERQMLCPEPAAAVEVKDMGTSHWVIQIDGRAIVAQAAKGRFFTNLSLRWRPLREEPALYSFHWTATLPDEAGQPLTHIVYTAFHPPEDCVSAVLSLHNDNGDFVAEGVRMEDFFLFYVLPNAENGAVVFRPSWFDIEECTYKLTFYGEDGNFIEEVDG